MNWIEIVLPEADATAPTNSGARCRGSEMMVSELPKAEIVTNPTGSVVAVVCAHADGARGVAKPITRAAIELRNTDVGEVFIE